jgi:hypothetical protein
MAKSAAVRKYTRNRQGREPEPQAAQEVPQDDAAVMKLQMQLAVESYISELQGLAEDQVGKKVEIEDRWYADLRRYYARYDAKTEVVLRNENKSRIFVSWTRNKTHQWESRLCDMLFPTDEKNWGIDPTPVPTLVTSAQNAAFEARNLTAKANLEVKIAANSNDPAQKEQGMQQAREYATQAQAQAEMALRKQAIIEEARKRCDSMEDEIEDQLVESDYNIKCREVVHDACLLGTGVMKGPLTANPERMRRPWKQRQNPDGSPSNVYELGAMQQEGVDWQRVNPWDFFPDMNAAHPREWEFTFERHMMTEKDMKKLGRTPGFDSDAIKDLLIADARAPLPNYIAQLREITNQQSAGTEGRYEVWEYHGPMAAKKLVTMATRSNDNDLASALAAKSQDDPTKEMQVIIWFCEGRLLMFGPHPLESGESLYSVFNFHRDESCVFGFGVPYLMQNSQAALNGAWRMILDNGTFAAGPQIIVDRKQVTPANKNWNVRGPKLWYLNEEADPTGRGEPIRIVQITNQQERIERIVEMAIKFADEEASMPLIAQGEQASHITNTASGMSMLMNSANVTFRHVVRNFDDNMTIPNIRRAYDWNMQNSQKEWIKGDYRVKARGSSVLMTRELQGQNLQQMLNNYAGHPILGPITKVANLYRKMVQAHMLQADEIVKTDDEIQADQDRAASQPPPPDPETEKLKTQQAIAQLEADTRVHVAEMQRDTAMIQLAEKKNLDLNKIRAMFIIKDKELKHKERTLAVEVAQTDKRDREARAAGAGKKDGKGKPGGLPATGGGYI